jgi:glutathione S-transferase
MLKLVGVYSSSFVRRVAISMQVLGVPYEHLPLSAFRDAEALRAINPLLKAPTLIFEDGSTLQESSFILDWLDSQSDAPLLPREASRRVADMQVLATALLAADKILALAFETLMRKPELQVQKVIERHQGQVTAALVALDANPRFELSLAPARPDQVLITTAAVVEFISSSHPNLIPETRYRRLHALSAVMEQHPAFVATRPVGP